MAEDRQQLTQDGQEVQQDDYNGLGEVAALADDRLLADILRLAPYDGSTVLKAVLPYHRQKPSGAAGTYEQELQKIIGTNGASGSVAVYPFRAILGPRTALATDVRKNWRDIRSSVFVGSTQVVAGQPAVQTVSLSANASGNPRWDLIYAAFTPDANAATVQRFVKDPSTENVTSTALVTKLVQTVAIGVTAGTPGASPSLPATPTDAAGTYYVPLGYVRVPNGFGGSSTVAANDIVHCAPVATIDQSFGGAVTCRPASSVSSPGSLAIPAAAMQAWGASGTPAGAFVPSTSVGGQRIVLPLRIRDASSANWSHVNNDVVDDRIDWRRRLFFGFLYVFDDNMPWEAATNGNFATGLTPVLPAGGNLYRATSRVIPFFGAGLNPDGGTARVVFTLAEATNGNGIMNAGSTVQVIVDSGTPGKMKVLITGTPLVNVIAVIDSTPPLSFGP